MNSTSYSSVAASGTGVTVILGWFMQLAAQGLAMVHIDMPVLVQYAIVGLVAVPVVKWLHRTLDVDDAPVVVPTPPAPTTEVKP